MMQNKTPTRKIEKTTGLVLSKGHLAGRLGNGQGKKTATPSFFFAFWEVPGPPDANYNAIFAYAEKGVLSVEIRARKKRFVFQSPVGFFLSH